MVTSISSELFLSFFEFVHESFSAIRIVVVERIYEGGVEAMPHELQELSVNDGTPRLGAYGGCISSSFVYKPVKEHPYLWHCSVR